MKADIPDSIIISRDKGGVLHHSYWTTDQQLVPFDETAFIRKDALMEWIQEARTIPHENTIARDLVFQEIVNALNSI